MKQNNIVENSSYNELQYHKNVLEDISYVKIILILFVILGHSVAFWSGEWFTKNPELTVPILSFMYSFLGSFHTYAFVILSGYIFSYKMAEGDYSDYKGFVYNKFKRLIVPYIFVSVVWVIPAAIFFMDYSMSDILLNFLLGINPHQLWFLLMLFFSFVFAWPIYKYVQGRYKLITLIGVLCYCVGVVGSNIIPNYFCIWNMMQYFLFFLIGIMLYGVKKEFFYKRKYIVFLGIMELFLLVFHIMIRKICTGLCLTIFQVVTNFGLHVVGSLFCICFAIYIIRKYINKQDKKNFNVSKYIMPVYLLHQQIIYIVITLTNGCINPYISVVLCFVSSTVLSFVMSYFMLKNKFLRLCIGG